MHWKGLGHPERSFGIALSIRWLTSKSLVTGQTQVWCLSHGHLITQRTMKGVSNDINWRRPALPTQRECVNHDVLSPGDGLLTMADGLLVASLDKGWEVELKGHSYHMVWDGVGGVSHHVVFHPDHDPAR